MTEVAPTQPDDASDGRPSLVGTLIGGRYRIEALLGTGGMGSVYRAEHVHMKKTLAVKVLHRELLAIDEVVARFEREAIAAGRIEHPNVAKATDFGRLEDGSFYLVMEFVSGRSLGALVGQGALPPARAVSIGAQIAAAVDAAHQAGIVHRDLKPDNVLLTEAEGEVDCVKVLDFGIAKLDATTSSGPSKLTRAGTVFGTPEYMAPEQAAGSAVDQRADLYALGVILYEMSTGQPPFDDADVVTLLTRQLTEPPPPLPSTLSPSLQTLVMQLLAKDPGDRPASAHEVMERLLAIENELASARQAANKIAFATTELAVEMPPAPPKSSGKKLIVIGALATLSGLVLTLVLLLSVREKPVPPPLLGAGAFSVSLPKPAATPAVRAAPQPEPPAVASTAAEPPKSAPRKSTGAKPKAPPKKKKTGPGGIYIPPPSQWF